MMEGLGQFMTVKTWLANKIANEVKRNIHMCDVYCVLKETDKAYYCILNLGYNFSRTMWIPKSAVEVKHNEYHETYRCDDYELAMTRFHADWKDYE